MCNIMSCLPAQIDSAAMNISKLQLHVLLIKPQLMMMSSSTYKVFLNSNTRWALLLYVIRGDAREFYEESDEGFSRSGSQSARRRDSKVLNRLSVDANHA
ncbi:hypothetical protein KC19_3G174100 [Ceratodon purpureus]|uniref:Uncharacterized protein n=1 Tax=Ceratodon purpureus TaxID=3225 RepID=A0A8T0ILX4_CERPU|nr:hypothetical protein KC19_3G174100 [Ceratodon purpureus]